MVQPQSKLKLSRSLFHLEEIGFCLFAVNHSSDKDIPACPSLELCPSDWLYFQKKCYYLSEKEANWNSSQNFCSSHNASLLVIESLQELVREQSRDPGFTPSRFQDTAQYTHEFFQPCKLNSFNSDAKAVTSNSKQKAAYLFPCKQQTSVLTVDVLEQLMCQNIPKAYLS